MCVITWNLKKYIIIAEITGFYYTIFHIYTKKNVIHTSKIVRKGWWIYVAVTTSFYSPALRGKRPKGRITTPKLRVTDLQLAWISLFIKCLTFVRFLIIYFYILTTKIYHYIINIPNKKLFEENIFEIVVLHFYSGWL